MSARQISALPSLLLPLLRSPPLYSPPPVPPPSAMPVRIATIPPLFLPNSGYALKIANSTSSRMPFLLASIPCMVLSASAPGSGGRFLPHHIAHCQFCVVNFFHLFVCFIQIIKMKGADNNQNNINDGYRRQKYKKTSMPFSFLILYLFLYKYNRILPH